ncbi:hypothetical protein CPLU01_00590 [Colletotrichum plurivorum]|uniref:Uncharacterized protein n=1 Tax=Colletotrichum plurivorum TaxID=2175906 RepID=A0A8H6NRX6_9PEZI|nr:hypothetical protein CPLU01_00590 [Colletotrichum plurivorum]
MRQSSGRFDQVVTQRRQVPEATGGDRRQGNMLKPNSFVRIRIVSPIPSFSIRHPARINQVLPSYPLPSTPSFVVPGELLATPGPSSDATTSPTYPPGQRLGALTICHLVGTLPSPSPCISVAVRHRAMP